MFFTKNCMNIYDKKITNNINSGKIVIYQTKDGNIHLQVKLQKDTVWLTQKQITQLFKTDRSVITKHLRNIFKTKELDKNSVCAIFAHTAADGKAYRTDRSEQDCSFEDALLT